MTRTSNNRPPSWRDVIGYCRELGWRDPLNLPEAEAGTETDSAASLADLASQVRECGRCGLAKRRNKPVFGEGDEHAPLMFIGEGPGAQEDKTGRPFVGRAGQLLDRMIFALGLTRNEVFITNIVKCRPPGNRDPKPEESAACSTYLDRQIELIEPRLIVTLGKPAANRLLGTAKTMTALRGQWTRYKGIPLLPIVHPAYLLRQPAEKRTAWTDLKAIRAKLQEFKPAG